MRFIVGSLLEFVTQRELHHPRILSACELTEGARIWRLRLVGLLELTLFKALNASKAELALPFRRNVCSTTNPC
jgi:hypothetical protein